MPSSIGRLTRRYSTSLIFLVTSTLTIPGCGSRTAQTPVSPSCSFGVSSATTSFGSAGSTGTASVTTGSGCQWTASSGADWVQVDGGQHTGTGTVTFTVTAATTATARTGVLVIAGQSLSISQQAREEGGSCQVTLTAQPGGQPRAGGSARLQVAAPAGCRWTIAQDAAWATLDATQGAGAATLGIAVRPNDDLAERRVTFSSGAASAVLSQPGQGDCTYGVGLAMRPVPRPAWDGAIDVETQEGCVWSAASDTPWLHVTRASGRGPTALTYAVDEYPKGPSATRSALLAVRWPAPTAGQNITLVQSNECAGLVAPQRAVPAEGGSFSEDVLVDPVWSCAWVASSQAPWLHIRWPQAGQVAVGDGGVGFTVDPNPSSAPRQGVIIAVERTLTVTQAGR